MDHQKQAVLIEWVNSMELGPSITRLSDLHDGNIITAIAQSMAYPGQCHLNTFTLEDVYQLLTEKCKDSFVQGVNLANIKNGDEDSIAKFSQLNVESQIIMRSIIEELFRYEMSSTELFDVLYTAPLPMEVSTLDITGNTDSPSNSSCWIQQPSILMSQTPIKSGTGTPNGTPNNTFCSPIRSVFNNLQDEEIFQTCPQSAPPLRRSAIRIRTQTQPNDSSLSILDSSPMQDFFTSPAVNYKIKTRHLEQKITALEKYLSNERQSKEELEKAYTEKEETIQALKMKIKSLTELRNQKQEELLFNSEKLNSLDAEKTSLVNENTKLKSRLIKKLSESDNYDLRKDLNEEFDKNEHLTQKVKELNKIIVEMRLKDSDYKSLEESFHVLQEQFTAQEATVTNLLSQIECLTVDKERQQEIYSARIKDLQLAVEEKNMNISMPGESMGVIAEQQVIELKENLSQIKSTWMDPETATSLKLQLQDTEEQLRIEQEKGCKESEKLLNANSDITKLRSEITNLQASYSEMSAVKNKLVESKSTLESQVVQLKESLQRESSELTDVKKENDLLSKKQDDLNKNIIQIQSELSHKCDELQKKQRNIEEITTQWHAEVANYKNDLKLSEENSRNLKSNCLNTERELSEKLAIVANLEARLKELDQGFQLKSEEFDKLHVEVDKHKKELLELEEKYIAKVEASVTLLEQNAELQNNITILKHDHQNVVTNHEIALKNIEEILACSRETWKKEKAKDIAEIKELKKDLDSTIKTRDSLKHENILVNEKLTQSEKINNEQKNANVALNNENKNMTQRVAALDEQCLEYQNQIGTAKEENEVVIKQLDEEKSLGAKLQEELNNLHAVVKEVKDANMRLQKDLEDVTMKVSDQKRCLADVEKARENLHEKLTSKENDLNEIKNKFSELLAQNNNLQQSLDGLNEANNSLKSELSFKEENCKLLKGTVEEQLNNISDLNVQISELETQITNENELRFTLEKEVSDAKAKNNTLSLLLEEEVKKTKQINEKLYEAERNFEENEQKNQNLSSEVDYLQEMKNNLEENSKVYLDEIRGLTKAFEDGKIKNMDKQKECENLQAMVNDLQLQINQENEIKLAVQKELTDSKLIIDQLKDQCSSITSEKNKISQKLQEITTSFDEQAMELNSSQYSLETMEQKYNIAMEINKSLEENVSRLQEKVKSLEKLTEQQKLQMQENEKLLKVAGERHKSQEKDLEDNIKDLQQQLQTAKESSASYLSSFNLSKKNIKHLSETIENLQTSLGKEEALKVQLEDELGVSKITVNDLKTSLEKSELLNNDISHKLKRLEEIIEEKSKRLQSSENLLQESCTKISILEEKCGALEKGSEDSEKLIADLNTKCISLQQEIDAERIKVTDCVNSAKLFEKDSQKLQEDLQEKIGHLENALSVEQKSVLVKLDAIASAEAQITELNKQVESLNLKLTDQLNAITSLEQGLTETKTDKEQLDALLNDKEIKQKDLLTKIQELEASCKEKSSMLEQSEKLLKESNTKALCLEKQCGSLTEDIESSKNQIQEINEIKSQLQQELKDKTFEFEKNLQLSKEEKSNLRQENQDLQDNIKHLKELLKVEEKSVTSKEEIIALNETRITDLNRCNDDLLNKLDEKNAQIESYERQIKLFQDTISSTSKMSQTAQKEFEILKEELNKKVSKSSIECENKNREIRNLKDENTRFKIEIKELKLEMEKQSSTSNLEISNLQRQIKLDASDIDTKIKQIRSDFENEREIAVRQAVMDERLKSQDEEAKRISQLESQLQEWQWRANKETEKSDKMTSRYLQEREIGDKREQAYKKLKQEHATVVSNLDSLQARVDHMNRERTQYFIRGNEDDKKSKQLSAKIRTLETQLEFANRSIKDLKKEKAKTSTSSSFFAGFGESESNIPAVRQRRLSLDESGRELNTINEILTPAKLQRCHSDDFLSSPMNRQMLISDNINNNREDLDDSLNDVLQTPGYGPSVRVNKDSHNSPVLQKSTRKVTRQRVCISVESSLLDDMTVDQRMYPKIRKKTSSSSLDGTTLHPGHYQSSIDMDASQGSADVNMNIDNLHNASQISTASDRVQMADGTHSLLGYCRRLSTDNEGEIWKEISVLQSRRGLSGFASKSMQTSEEPENMQWGSLGRLAELQRRNAARLPHLKSSYPAETQGMTPSRSGDNVRVGDPNSTMRRMTQTSESLKQSIVSHQNSPRRMTISAAEMNQSRYSRTAGVGNTSMFVNSKRKSSGSSEDGVSPMKTRRRTIAGKRDMPSSSTGGIKWQNATTIIEQETEQEDARDIRRQSVMFEIVNSPRKTRQKTRGKKVSENKPPQGKGPQLRSSTVSSRAEKTPERRSLMERMRQPLHRLNNKSKR